MNVPVLVRDTFLWSVITLACYVAAKALHRRVPSVLASPVVVVPLLLALALAGTHTPYARYAAGTRWLVTLLAPSIVAFAVPFHAQRALIRRTWPALAAGVLAGSAVAIATSVWLSNALGLGAELRASLVPRSISTPFAMIVSREVGGTPNVTAAIVVFTGVVGAMIGEALLALPALRHRLARGALMGMGAHGVGSARAHQIAPDLGAIAALVMVLAGVLNVLLAPLLAAWGVGR